MLKRFAFLLTFLAAVAAHAQPKPGAKDAIKFDVAVGGQSMVNVAVPDAVNIGGSPDTRGVTEALSGTVQRDLTLAGYFNLIDKASFLIDPKVEGMDPQYKAWFNVGAQGLVKIGFQIVGTTVKADLRLYSVDRSQRVALPAPYDAVADVELDPDKLRRHAHGFVDQVIKYYTGTEGFFRTRIVFVKRIQGGKELFMLAPDGSDEMQLTKNGSINMLPSFNAGKIIFTSFKDGNPDLFTLEKGASSKLSSYPGLNTGGVLSPDGTRVAATISKDGNPEIYLLEAGTGKVIKRLTNTDGIDASPTWSPDGSQIAFVSDRHGTPQIWVMGADGGNARRLTYQGDYNQTPDWSPRGDLIAFTARDERYKFDVFTVNVSTGEVARVTQDQGNNEEPSFSPDGRYLIFSSTRSGEAKLFLSTLDGRVQHPVSQGKGEYLTPAWQR